MKKMMDHLAVVADSSDIVARKEMEGQLLESFRSTMPKDSKDTIGDVEGTGLVRQNYESLAFSMFRC